MTLDGASQRPNGVLRGVILVIAAAFTISVQDVVFKSFSNTMTLWQMFTLRGALAILLLLAVGHVLGGRIFRQAFNPWVLLRGGLMAMTFLAFYAAVPFLSLSTLGAANYMAPIFVALLSAFVISEPVMRRGWIAVFAGFLGVLILLRPGTDAFSPWSLLPLLGAMFYASAHILTRSKCRDVPLLAMALAVILATMVAGLVGSLVIRLLSPDGQLTKVNPYLLGPWASLGGTECLVLIALALLMVTITVLLAGGYQAAPPATAATFEYSYLVFVALWDLLFLAAPPDATTLIGMVMIVAAGLLILSRNSHGNSIGTSPTKPDN